MREDSPEQRKPLRSGYTTGACATAASLAAARRLLTEQQDLSVQIRLPRGAAVTFTLQQLYAENNRAHASLIKDAGDDPDVTHGAEVFAEVSLSDVSGVRFFAGPGVGTVTKAGLALAVGEPAINPVPRQMICQHLAELAAHVDYAGGFDVTIGIKGGEALARKTMNPRLGIQGGLSILGTTGIVKPFSCSAYIASIQQGMDVARANGIDHIAACTGRTSESLITRMGHWPEMAIIEMGDFLGAVLKHLKQAPFAALTIAGGLAKISKIAAGHVNLHSRHAQVDFQHLATLAKQHGADDDVLMAIRHANTTAEAQAICAQRHIPLAEAVCAQAYEQLRPRCPKGMSLEIIAVNKAGDLLGRAGQRPGPAEKA